MILVCIMLIAAVIITGKRLFVCLGHLIALSCSTLAANFAAWRKKRGEERLFQADSAEDNDSILEDDEDFEAPETEPDPKPTKKTVPNIIIHKSDSAKPRKEPPESSGSSKTPAPADSNPIPTIPLTESSDVSSAAAAAEETVTASDIRPFTDEQLNTYDHGQTVKPLRIQIPEFMKPTVLSPDDLNLEIEGLPEEMSEEETEHIKPEPIKAETIEPEPIQTNELLSDTSEQNIVEEIDISKILSEIPKKSSEFSGSRTVSAGFSRTTESEAKSDPAVSDSDEPLKITEEEIEKYEFPPLDLLDQGRGSTNQQTASSLKQTALKLKQTFESFGVGVQVTNVSCGPAVTRYELQPDQGVKVSRIVSLSDDIKLNLAVADIRIEAPIPGKAAVGIEVHHKEIYLRDLLESDKCSQNPNWFLQWAKISEGRQLSLILRRCRICSSQVQQVPVNPSVSIPSL
ncbi:MAG: DNA translocase FtsK [Coprococcus sp.]